MEEKILKYLYDISLACAEIESFKAPSFQHNKDSLGQLMQKKAIERNLEIIGEAVRRITHVAPEYPITNAKNIIALRNLIIHAYDSISDETIQSVVDNHLPMLRDEISALIKNIESSHS
jgi:uncharacterized protein with HEPN domain